MPRCAQGHENPDGQSFCGQCGAPITIQPPSPEPTSETHLTEALTLSPANETHGGRKARWKYGLAGVLAFVLIIVLLATFLGGSRTIHGQFTLFSAGDVRGSPTECEGTGGYSDVDAGMPVTARDQDGKIVGSSHTRNGESLDELARRIADSDTASDVAKGRDLVSQSEGLACILLFDVDVENADFYEIEVGRRGKISYSKTELDKRKWKVAFTLGS